jgi:hypothetical protein
VVFLGYRRADGKEGLSGSAFFLGRVIAEDVPDRIFSYLVTAKHVIQSITKKGMDTVIVRANHRDGRHVGIETKASAWMMHDDPSVDVAVLKFIVPNDLDHTSFPCYACDLSQLATDVPPPDVGDELFFTGLFSEHFGRTRNIPIVRVGNIAALPEEPISTKMGKMKAYLVEARSIGGLSGSPVFINLSGMRGGGISAGGNFFLLGLIHGHFDTDDSDVDALVVDDGLEKTNVNMGIGIVVPSERILEVINKFADIEKPIIEEERRKRLPTMDTVPEPKPGATVFQSFIKTSPEGT